MAMTSAAGWKLWLAPALRADRQWDDGDPTSSARGLDDVLGASERRPTWEKEEGSSGRLRRAHHGGNGTRTAFGQRRSAAFGPGAVGTLGGFRQAVGWGHIRDRRRRPGRPIGAQRAATESLPCGSHSSALFHFWKIWRLDFHTRKIDRKGGKIIENFWS
jgi:hypothetical protein